MLVEKFDFIELLRLAIAQSEGKGKLLSMLFWEKLPYCLQVQKMGRITA